MDNPYADRFWHSPDGLKLHYRDYPGREDRPPVLCLHGLTRNARDFASLAARLSGDWRVIVPEMRGRGDSEYARESASYTPATYVEDVRALLGELGHDRVVIIGTSLGGLMTMILATLEPQRIAAAALNDIGPELEREGLDRIREYVGQGRSFATWMHAARALSDIHQEAHPDYALDDWLAMAKRGMTLGQSGRISFDYDMAIAEPFAEGDNAAPPDLWPAFEALSGRPLLLLRGELSTLLSKATAQEMARRVPDLEVVTVPRVGHAPTLDEPESVAAIDRLLARVA